jgi:transposase
VIGLDDWALARGRQYGTLVVDLETHRPIDLFPDRTAESVAAWLKAHPGASTVSRDRSKEYKAGISQGAPQAIQVADRWHLLKNLGEAIQRVLGRQPKALRAAAHTTQDQAQATTTPAEVSTTLSAPTLQPSSEPSYRQQVFGDVKARIAQGESNRTIARQLHLHRQTVARYRQLEALPPRTAPQNCSSVAAFLPDLHRRWTEAGQNTKQIWRDLQTQGYRGSYMSVYRAVRHFSDYVPSASVAIQPSSPALSPRQAMWLLVREPSQLTPEQVFQCQALCTQCAEAATIYPLAQRFVNLVKQRQVDELDPWLKDARASDLSTFRHLAADLQQDYAAVKAALTLDASNGQLEGQISRLKYLKRQMYGRAKFDLLRLRVLHPP